MTAKRLDQYLVQAGIASGRGQAKSWIASGQVCLNGQVVTKPAIPVLETDVVTCTAPPPPYVGRGGFKLEKALREAGICPRGWIAVDIGASTGGFTDCLLQHGAARVYAVDVGHGQLHERLRRDPRVISLEGIDGRDVETLKDRVAEYPVALITMDLSFISLTRVLPGLWPLAAPGGRLVCLIKPQFEAGRAAVGKNGLVRDPAVHRAVLRQLWDFFEEQGWQIEWLSDSPITGGDGNIEYLAVLKKPPENGERSDEGAVTPDNPLAVPTLAKPPTPLSDAADETIAALVRRAFAAHAF